MRPNSGKKIISAIIGLASIIYGVAVVNAEFDLSKGGFLLSSSDIIEGKKLIKGTVEFIPYAGPFEEEYRWIEVEGKAACESGVDSDACRLRAIKNGLSNAFDRFDGEMTCLVESSSEIKNNKVRSDDIKVQRFLFVHPHMKLIRKDLRAGESRIILRARVSAVSKEKFHQLRRQPGMQVLGDEYARNTFYRSSSWDWKMRRGIHKNISKLGRKIRNFIW